MNESNILLNAIKYNSEIISSVKNPAIQKDKLKTSLGLIIFVHGVNSEGEWYDTAEQALCDGLNKRLTLEERDDCQFTANLYAKPYWNKDKSKWVVPQRKIDKEGHSPVIRFYWGYRAQENEADKYTIPLKNRAGDNFYDLTPEERQTKGPFFWGGGPLQNGCNQLVSLWSEEGFSKWPTLLGLPLPFSVQTFNSERDRLLTSAPARHYYAHAVGRLAKLIKRIRELCPQETVSVLAHSQGTMLALAAAAIEAPDALFLMNSPYALENVATNYVSYPLSEIVSNQARAATFADIVKKVAEKRLRITAQAQSNKKNSSLSGSHHGNTFIYCSPHDRVMGAAPLRSIGWQGLPNIKEGGYRYPNPLFNMAGETLYVRMLARNTPCGMAPNPLTPFGDLGDGQPFWDSTTSLLNKLTWPEPDKEQKMNINAPAVPYPISAEELKDFDLDYPSIETQTGRYGYGFGQINPESDKPNDETYRFYIALYGYFDQKMRLKPPSGYYQPGPGSKEDRIRYQKQTRAEMLEEVSHYVQRPTDHSSLPGNYEFMARVVAYDLPINSCAQLWDGTLLEELRRFADWLESDDYYYYGKLSIPKMPQLIRTDLEQHIDQKRVAIETWMEEINEELKAEKVS